jgi:hypothetical protein
VSTILREAYVRVKPDTDGFDDELKRKLRRADPGGKAGVEIGSRLNAALKRVNVDAIDVKADPKKALAALDLTEHRLRELSGKAATVEVKIHTERALGELGRFRKQLGDVGGEAGPDAALGFAARFSQRLGPLVANLPISGPMAAALGAAAVSAAPVIIPAISAAVSAGVGAGALGIGLALAAKDPLVAERGKQVGEAFVAGLQAEASQAFQGPLLVSLNKFEALGIRTSRRLGAAFESVAPHLVPLVDKLVSAADQLGDSFANAAVRSGPALDALGDSVTLLSTGVSKVIDTLSKGGPEAAANLRLIAGATADIAVQTANFLDIVNKLSSNPWITGPLLPLLRKHYDDAADGGNKAADAGKNMGVGVTAASTATHQFIMDTSRADPPVKALVISLNNAEKAALGQRSALVGLSNQLRAQVDPAFALILAQKDLKTAQDKAAEAVKNHGRKSEEAKTATRNLALAAIDLQGKVGALGDKFTGKLTPAMRDTLHAGGLTDQQIKDIAKQFRDAKRDGDKYAKKYQADARLTGGSGVSTKLKILGEMQAALAAGNKPASYYGNLNKALLGLSGPQINRAEGGPIPGYSPHKRADNIPAMLTAKEWVQPVDSVDYYGPGVMKAIQQRKIPAADLKALASYASGGPVWPYNVTASQTRVPSWKEASSVVTPAVPKGQTLDFMVRAVHAAFPGMRLISGYRPGAHTLSGAVSYHALKRATDWPASKPLAEWINARYFRRTKELISPWNSLNIHNGARHAYSGAVYRQHSGGNAHVHWAMAGGGVIREPVWGVGASGRTYSFGERGPETVTPGTGGDTYVFHFSGPVASQRAMDDMVVEAVKRAKQSRRLP